MTDPTIYCNNTCMSIPAKFMEIARGKLDPVLYKEIYDRAIVLDRQQIDNTSKPKNKPIDNPNVIERIEAHLNGEKQPTQVPHIKERIERRLEIDITPSDLGELLSVVRAGGVNVQVIRQEMDLMQECVVNWRGKHFIVIYNKSRNKLVTAFAKKTKLPKIKTGRPRDWQARNIDDQD